MGTAESLPQPQLTRESLVGIASQGRNPENKERILAGLPKKIQKKLDFTGPEYDSRYGLWDALLEAQLGETHPALQEGGRQKLVKELYGTLLSFGFDVSDKSLPFDRLVEAYLKSLNIQPPEQPWPPKLGIKQKIAANLRRKTTATPPSAESLRAEMAAPEAGPKISLVAGVGFSEDANRKYRPTMEDAHTIVENFGGKPDQSFFAIYDGHGGREVADFAATRLHENLLRLLQAGTSPTVALKTAYQTTDDQITREKIKPDAGATTVTALVQGNKLYVANAGDARAVLNREGKAIRLSHDHKPDDLEEQKRIEAAGGRVTPRTPIDVARVAGYAIARALGDRSVKLIIPDPYLREEQISPQDSQLILACDGVWDVISDQETVDLIKNESDPQKASEILRNEALRRGSTDNISIVVVRLTP